MASQPENPTTESDSDSINLRHAVGADEHLSLQRISEVVYPLFQVESGTIKLSGCSIEPTPVLKLKLTTPSEASEIIYFSLQGEISHDFAKTIGIHEWEETSDEPSWLKAPSKRAELDHLIESAQSKLGDEFQRVFKATVCWCKRVDGKLAIEIGEQSDSIKFSFWAQRMVDGLDSCPPYLCQYSGKSSYQIVLDDMGQMTVPEAIQTCQITQTRLVETEIQPCSISNQKVATSELWTCPASGKKLLKSFSKKCAQCDQEVSPGALERGFCIVCRSMSAADPENPTIQKILESFPTAENYGGWKESACQSFAVLACRRRFKRLLFVIDLTDDSVVKVRHSSVLGLRWRDIDQDEL